MTNPLNCHSSESTQEIRLKSITVEGAAGGGGGRGQRMGGVFNKLRKILQAKKIHDFM